MDQKIKEAVHVFFYIDGASRLLCVSGGFSHAETRARRRIARFASKKEAKEEMLGLFQDRGFFYLTAIALFMQVVFKRAQIVPFDFFRHFWQVQAYKLFLFNQKKRHGRKGWIGGISEFPVSFF